MLSRNRLQMYTKLVDEIGKMPFIIESTTMQDDGFMRVVMHRVIDDKNTMTCEFRMVVDADEYDRTFVRLFLDKQSIMFNGESYRFDGYRIGLIDSVSLVVRFIEMFIHE